MLVTATYLLACEPQSLGIELIQKFTKNSAYNLKSRLIKLYRKTPIIFIQQHGHTHL